MSNLRKLTYGELKHRKELMVNAKAFSIDDEDRMVFQKAIEGIEDEMYRREINGSRTITAVVGSIVITAILLMNVNCQTFKGVTGDAGWILTKMSDNIQVEQEK